jgi:SAM-dependent methyltransferase
MQLDLNQIRDVINARHGYYRNRPRTRVDSRWHPDVVGLFKPELTTESRVLEVGCGDGGMLFELSPFIHSGVGVDYDPEHLRLAEEAKREQGVANLEFIPLDYPGDAERLEAGTFDLVYDLRGPLPETTAGFQAARRLLKPGGLLFCEGLGENHQKEKMVIFEPSQAGGSVRSVGVLQRRMERNGFDVRFTADAYTKWIYPDIYAWLQMECNIRAWLGVPLPEPDDPRIASFAERNTNAAGEIVTTHHVVWVAGVMV